MTNRLKGTETEKNLQAAFAGESMARNKYDYYASQAKKEGYEQIADFFMQTALNEQAHAKIWFKLLHNGIPQTTTNLADARDGENYEHTKMYAEFEKMAKKEGFDDIAKLFAGVGKIEKDHEDRYAALLANINNGTVYSKKSAIIWHCRNCGHTTKEKDAPKTCSICFHPQSYFEQKQTNY